MGRIQKYYAPQHHPFLNEKSLFFSHINSTQISSAGMFNNQGQTNVNHKKTGNTFKFVVGLTPQCQGTK